ncbi:MAG: bacteriohopanetetrol glucosamine biosynthesis glycosyltransferase HpnI [Desulforhabdus sp.]|nr:bacteriohopanetetrol glucosamine biosynthesis glycosyltransferase HpnI [Desulforhabdus sp.]
MNIVDVILLSLIALSLGFQLVSTRSSLRFFIDAKRPKQSSEDLPPVSVIKPVTRADAEQIENFISFFEQDYPAFEVVFSLSRSDETVVSVLENLKNRFPAKDICWVLNDKNPGPNYKVGNLIGAINSAKFDTLIISDSDIRVGPEYLRRIVTAFQREGADIVTCLYRGTRIGNIPSALHALTIQTDFIPNVIMGYEIEGISYAFGATICTSKTVISKFGGLEPIRDYLADDYQIGFLARQNGFEVHLSRHLIDHHSHFADFSDYFFHQLRWAVTQRVCRPWGYLASGITHGVSLATILLITSGFSPLALAVFTVTLIVRLLCFSFLNRKVIHNDEAARYAWLIPIKDWVNSLIWIFSLFTDRVRWQQRRFRVVRGGRIHELNEAKKL